MIDIEALRARAKGQCECTGQCGAHQPREVRICKCGHGTHWHTFGTLACTCCTAEGKTCERFELDHAEEKLWRCQDRTSRIDKRTGLRVALEPMELAGGEVILACPSCRWRRYRGYVAPKPPEKPASPQADLF